MTMHVIATAGHVDHGKSTLVRALTGRDPDRLAEEHRRGLSIQLGYAWTSLEGIGDVAFVDVPGHERFIATALSGVGPVPAVMFVVAADDPWMPQATEHLNALDALGVSHGVLVITRIDLADPTKIRRQALSQFGRTSLRGAPVVHVSGHTGEGLDELRSQLASMLRSLPAADAGADVRLWVDRRFSMRGAGTVITGTLPSGRISIGDSLSFGAGTARVRGIQMLGESVSTAEGVARVALNVTGVDAGDGIERGSVLVTPDAWHFTSALDVRLSELTAPDGRHRPSTPPNRPMLHVGTTSMSIFCRPLGREFARLRLYRPLPLRVGERVILRDPGNRQIWGAMVLDPAPPELRSRGSAARRAEQLMLLDGSSTSMAEVDRRGLVHSSLLQQIGIPFEPGEDTVTAEGWLLSSAVASALSTRLEQLVRDHDRGSPLDAGIPLVTAAERLELPSLELVRAVVRRPIYIENGRVMSPSSGSGLDRLQPALDLLRIELEAHPFAAPSADRLKEMGWDNKGLAAAAKAGWLLRLPPNIVLLPGADHVALARLRELDQPFTLSEAKAKLRTSRRVAVPLLEHLDRQRFTRRLPDDRRELRVG
jgi:selenocysteine-specific elongation factor